MSFQSVNVGEVHVVPAGSITEVPNALAGPVPERFGLPEIERLQAIEVAPGALLVVTISRQILSDQARDIHDVFARALPHAKVVLVTSDITVSTTDVEPA